ncbi:dihydroxyacetone kinase phosphoryl donor subunit DhaM [Cellulomonas fengjieae]|uniref:dihydroxyacetone kinase phosphoryl donor subunit DhaM n=1 Tax=Cellulomonas fengjieae TaxID=2819978 RepID=UPI001AAF13F7|nr:dihydroxyacetone kinase phosphoryl donor subunit DhaM [Cellulomonas fengjieae]MBO3103234.1 PTS-dependent dihydroxyacetone kinase phosphotransferase subunit DhaM [Cellulomonas fengjieae]
MTSPDARRFAPVALVLVSHSRALAQGAAELAGQMAPDVLLVSAGGTDDGGLGTSYETIESALVEATRDGRSAVVLTDLGSAVLTTESVLELADDDVTSRVRLADAPFVEGAVAAAVTANGGADVATVLASAQHAGTTFAPPAEEPAPAPAPGPVEAGVRGTAVLRNPLGLHARPAAVLARMVAGYDARVTVNGANAASVLELMKLGVTQGAELAIEADGPEALEALAAVVAAVEGGFGEV